MKTPKVLDTWSQEASDLINSFEEADEKNEKLKNLQGNLLSILNGSEEMLYAIKTIKLSKEEIEGLKSLHELAVLELEKLGKALKVFRIDSAIKKLQKIANETFEDKGFGFGFNNLKNMRIENFSSKAPKWRIVIPGLNLYGKCNTPTCEAYNNVIWIQKEIQLLISEKRPKRQIVQCAIKKR